ncbi:MAG: hypothetical protein CMF31_10115 [Kordiimonas sp.]|nr:hypothetical protein [Kordiimonas sp.]|tara:strand:+ start:3441 stop:4745 length:1305 start_codon:yes stop_codon:yes gene_type:complete
MRTIFFLYLVLLFSALTHVFVPLAVAQNKAKQLDAFSIYNISVDTTARTASEARSQALHIGQRQALTALFDKIVRPEDISQLPQLDNAKIASLVRGIDISQERSSTVRYIANFTVHFSREHVFNLLSGLNIPFAETMAKPLWVLPIISREGTYSLWESGNDWLSFWQQQDFRNNLVPFIVPTATYQNIFLIDALQAYQGNAAALARFARHHQVDDILVPIITLPVTTANSLEHTHLATITLRRGLTGDIILQQDIRLTTADINNLTELGDNGDNSVDILPSLYEKALRTIRQATETEWKNKVLVHYEESAKLTISYNTKSVKDWQELQNKISSQALILKTTLHDVSTDHLILTLHYAGTVEQLQLSLQQQDLFLVPGEAGWMLLTKQEKELIEASEDTPHAASITYSDDVTPITATSVPPIISDHQQTPTQSPH